MNKKITIYELLGLVKDGKVPSKIKYDDMIFEYDGGYYSSKNNIILEEYCNLTTSLNDEVEIIEEEKKFTKEDFINERMKIDKITRKEFDEMYEVKECNCGRGYCKGFIKVEKVQEEKKIPEKLEQIMSKRGKYNSIDELAEEVFKAFETIDDLIIKQNKIIDYLKSKEE